MNKVKVLKCPLFIVLDEFIVEMSLWEIISTILVMFYNLRL